MLGVKLHAVLRNLDLAWSLKQIARHGRKAFYQGEIAKRILATSEAKGGTLTAADLANFFPSISRASRASQLS